MPGSGVTYIKKLTWIIWNNNFTIFKKVILVKDYKHVPDSYLDKIKLTATQFST